MTDVQMYMGIVLEIGLFGLPLQFLSVAVQENSIGILVKKWPCCTGGQKRFLVAISFFAGMMFVAVGWCGIALGEATCIFINGISSFSKPMPHPFGSWPILLMTHLGAIAIFYCWLELFTRKR